MKNVDLYFDYASPWAYIANEVASQKLAGIAISHHPIYLRGLETFSKGIPYGGAKLQYLARDAARVADHEGVTLAPPASFPVDGLQALRASYVALESGAFDRYHRAAFRAVWAEGRDTNDKHVVARILAEATGASEGTALEAMAAPAIKNRLRDATALAEQRGIFGTPTFFVGDEMYWGHDRLDYVSRAARA